MQHTPRKRFGQHFLTDPAVIDAIVRAIAPASGQAVVEIGPGLMALTRPLLQSLGQLSVLELDRDLAARLRQTPGLDVVQGDALRADFRAIATRLGVPKLRVLGNLPYNISTSLLFHLLEQVDVVQDQHFMLQKEVVERMVAAPAGAAYSRLSVMLQWRYAMEQLLTVAPGSFTPPPRVQSAVVRMLPRAQPAALDARVLQELLRVAFGQRRKLLRHTLGRWLEAKGYSGSFDVQRRAEEVPPQEYAALAAYPYKK